MQVLVIHAFIHSPIYLQSPAPNRSKHHPHVSESLPQHQWNTRAISDAHLAAAPVQPRHSGLEGIAAGTLPGTSAAPRHILDSSRRACAVLSQAQEVDLQ